MEIAPAANYLSLCTFLSRSGNLYDLSLTFSSFLTFVRILSPRRFSFISYSVACLPPNQHTASLVPAADGLLVPDTWPSPSLYTLSTPPNLAWHSPLLCFPSEGLRGRLPGAISTPRGGAAQLCLLPHIVFSSIPVLFKSIDSQQVSTFELVSRMAELLSSSACDSMRMVMDETTSDPNRIPGCVAVVVDKAGKTLFQHASGTRGADTREPMTLDSVVWIASCTKMICGIAAMQLVEQGKLAFDDADLVENHCPELKHVKIIKGIDQNGKAETVEKKNRITLRMLLNHTGKPI